MALIDGTGGSKRVNLRPLTDNARKPEKAPDPLFTRVAGETPRASADAVRASREKALLMTPQDEMRLIREHANARRSQVRTGIGEEPAAAVDAGFQYPPDFKKVSPEQLRQIMPAASDANIERYAEPLNQAMAQHNINTPERQQAFLAQVAHESGQLNYSEEIASGRAYEGRADLGNTQPGDGERFKGRGLIQLTGRANYAEMSERFGQDLVGNPAQVANDPFLSARVAAHYFESRGLNELADGRKFVTITERINGGRNGLADRQEFYAQAQDVIT